MAYTFSSSSRDHRRQSYDTSYAFRGFSTSFSHSFVDPNDEKGDICSLACCGLLQSYRNHFLLFGGVPSLFALKFTVFVVLPAFTFAAGVNLIYKRRRQEFYAGVALLSVATLYFIVQLIKKTLGHVSMRREVLKRHYANEDNARWVHRRLRNKDDEEEEYYLMGQTHGDLISAHAPCGCYKGDVAFEELEAPLPSNLCDFMWQSFMACCCEYSYNRFLQCCGICGVAQESREIDKMFPPHRRAFDYVTMQPVLEYYSYILVARADRKGKLFDCFLSLSSLSRNILQSYLLIGGAIALFCYLFEVSASHLTMVTIVFLVANIFLWAVYFRYTNLILSEDAVIKGFASGFYIAGTLAVPFLAIVLLLTEVIQYFLVEFTADFDGHFWYGYSMRGNGSEFFTPWKTDSGFMMSKYNPIAFFCFSFCQCFLVAFIQELAKYLAFRLIADHPDFWTRTDLEKIVHKTEFNEPVSNLDLESLPHIEARAHVRPLRYRCSAIVVAAVSVSLGCACFENIFYACVYYYVNITWFDVLARSLLLASAPVSAVFQAIGVCRGTLELKVHVKAGSIINSAVIFHGLFDFAVIVGDYIAESEFREGYLKFASRTVIPFGIVILGSCWAALSLYFLKTRLDEKDTNTIDVRNTWIWPKGPSDGFHVGALAKGYDVSRAASATSSESSGSDEETLSTRGNRTSVHTTGLDDQATAATTIATKLEIGDEIDDLSQTSIHSERWISLTKSLDDILRDVRAAKSAIIYRPGTWEVEENAQMPVIPKGYTPPGNASLT
ncbi:hypothetical protein MHU86_5043 [Fragilaria crotonensis]|nr:hypothetical protein MHU86_5043 [Fragilaria crotonensis]